MDVAALVKKHVDNCKEREPIFVKDIVVTDENKNARNIAFHKLERSNIIRPYKKGIYYKPQVTMFGELGIDTNKLIEKQYIKDANENIKGYITGPVIWNEWKISTQIPNRKCITTNSVNRNIELQDIRVKLIKPKTKIDNDNYKILQMLDVIDNIYDIQDINWNNYIDVLVSKINDLKVKELGTAIELAKTYNKFVNNFIGALIEARIKKSNEDNKLLHKKIQELKFKANTGRRYKVNPNIKFRELEEWGFYQH